MILIADSGSTKTDWILLNTQKERVSTSVTEGLNPSVFSESDLYKTITSNNEVMQYVNEITVVYIYAAGCGTATPKEILKNIVIEVFANATTVAVKEDIYAAAFSVSEGKKGIVCIIGTGSNTCYYDGKNEIKTKIPSLGYLLMDDASGNYFGKLLLRDYFYKKMPKKLYDMFQETYNLNPDDVKINLYQKGNPNTYLAHFAPFLITHKKEPYCVDIIRKGFSNFIENQITQHDNVYDLPIHFVGSIAYHLQDELKYALKSFRLNVGNFVQKPIDGLLAYHLKNS